MISIVADVGGTQSRLVALNRSIGGEQTVICELDYQSQDFDNIEELLRQFLRDSGYMSATIEQMVLAVPGPISDGTVRLTNLDWQLNSYELQKHFSVESVKLMNDFEAAALGTLTLESDDYVCLNRAGCGDNGMRLVLGAGTGLGMAYLYRDGERVMTVATEGGHIDFSPTNDVEVSLYKFLNNRYQRVSYERILSGPGLIDLYDFCSGMEQQEQPVTAEWVNRMATEENLSFARDALVLFTRIYGQFVGNMVLAFRPEDGVYLTGGVTAKVKSWLVRDEFRDAYLTKGRMQGVVEQTPVYLITNERIGVQGAIKALDFDTRL